MRVLLGDAESLFRDAMASALASEPDFEVVATAADALELVREASRARPEVALLGWRLPRKNGTSIPALIQQYAPGCSVLVLSDAEDVGELLEALESGANGYLTKRAPLPEVLEATRAVCRGEMVIAPSLVGKLVARLLKRRDEEEQALLRLSRLTHREQMVLDLLSGGNDNEAIARKLVISPRTAATHVQNIMRKLEVHSRLEAATFLARAGLDSDRISTRWRTAGDVATPQAPLMALVEDSSTPPSFVIQRKRGLR